MFIMVNGRYRWKKALLSTYVPCFILKFLVFLTETNFPLKNYEIMAGWGGGGGRSEKLNRESRKGSKKGGFSFYLYSFSYGLCAHGVGLLPSLGRGGGGEGNRMTIL